MEPFGLKTANTATHLITVRFCAALIPRHKHATAIKARFWETLFGVVTNRHPEKKAALRSPVPDNSKSKRQSIVRNGFALPVPRRRALRSPYRQTIAYDVSDGHVDKRTISIDLHLRSSPFPFL